MSKKERKCPSCQMKLEKNKRICRNVLCKQSKPYNEIKQKLEGIIKEVEKMLNKEQKIKEKEQKRLAKEIEKRLRTPRAGMSVKGRDGSTRHGFVISYSKYHSPKITIEELDHRNHLLQLDPKKCFWCKDADMKDGDHAHPCCNTTMGEYSYTNSLNIVPACKSCNSLKSGKRLLIWIDELLVKGWWTLEQINIYKQWLDDNKEKLQLNEGEVTYVERQFPTINRFHAWLEYCVKYRLDVGDYINVPDVPDAPPPHYNTITNTNINTNINTNVIIKHNNCHKSKISQSGSDY